MLSLKLTAPIWAALTFLLICLVRPGEAIFQDEAYNLDYAHALVGTPIRRNTFFHRPDTASKATLLYTLSEEGVVGAINPRDGELVWRVLANDTVSTNGEPAAQGILRAQDSSTTIVSGTGNAVRAWDAKDGRMIWQWRGGHAVKSLEVLGLEGSQGDIIAVTEGEESGGTVWRLSGTDGTPKWTSQLASADYPLGVSASASSLFCTSLSPAGRNGGYKIRVQTLDPATGKEISQNVLDTEHDVSSEESIVHLSGTSTVPIVAWKDDKFKDVKFNMLGSKQIAISMINPYGTVDIKSASVHESSSTKAKPHFLLQFNKEGSHRGEIWHIDSKSGKMDRAFEIDQKSGDGVFSVGDVDGDVYFIHHTQSEAALFASSSREVLEVYANPTASSSEQLQFATSEIASRGGTRFSVRNAYVHDGDWTMLQNGALAWRRHEGLTGIVAAAWIDIPTDSPLKEALSAEIHANPLSAYVHRVQRHIGDLQYFPAWLAGVPARIISSFTGTTSTSADVGMLQPDTFGFNKIVVVATKKGRIAGLASAGHGKVLWSRQVLQQSHGEDWQVKSLTASNNNALIIGIEGQLLVIHALTGRTEYELPRKQNSDISHYVVASNAADRGSFCVISKDGTPGKLPEGIDRMIITQRTDGSVAGWRSRPEGGNALAWSFLPKAGETVDTLSTRPIHDPVSSIGRALGDRNVLYKYLSSNLILVTATSLAASTLSIYLLDSITGQTMYSTSHSNVDVSIAIPVTFSENWFAYSMFSDLPQGATAETAALSADVKAHQLIVSELFESSISNDRGPLGSASNYSALDDLYTPEVKSAAFVVPAPVTVLSTTSTSQGITPRSLLAYSPALAGLLAIPVPLLSPRRPIGRDPTVAEREEGLPRYQAHLDFQPPWFLSHKRELLGIEEIISAPTQMESTSLIFAYGALDVFGTKVAPIGTFDVLSKGFGKIQLILTCVALAVGTGLLSPMAKKKQIDSLWRS